nr:MFS transporter [uncultured Rhodoferax sp.]
MSAAAVHGTPAQIRQATWATRSLFAALGVLSAAWGVHIPSVKAHYGLGEGALSLVLVAAASGAVLALFFAGRVIGRLGARNAAALCALVMAFSLGMALQWPSFALLLLSMVVFGSSLSVYDVAINTEGSALESAGGRPIMGGLHGMFSVGGMAGAALAAGLLRGGVPAPWQLTAVGVGIAAWVLVGSRWMLPTAPDTETSAQKPHFAWPRGALLVIGLLIFAGMSAEGVMYDWCVLYLQQEVGMPQAQAALGYAAFSGAMATMRFVADSLRARFSEQRLLRASGTTTALAMAVVLLSGSPWVSLLGYAFIGAGLAMVVPILYGAASRVPGTTPAAAIAAVSSIGYSGFMIGPPLIGGIAQHASLTLAMGVVVVAATILALSAHHVPEKT